ncbi:MAG TPA: polymer-forming cytoskeletal protein [Saprospiraceae bacterium]|nr:polymer-forming cytoskeletal protein [Saprospiraceae bacterium]
MFGANKSVEEPKKSSGTPLPSGMLNALVKGTSVEGTFRCESDLRIDGTIKGKLNCQAKVIIGPSGAVDGEIRCQNAVIEGRFKGNLFVSELLNVRETAEIDGEITTNKLLVQSGAKFNVACHMDAAAANGSTKNVDVKSANDATATAREAVAGKSAAVRN